MTAVILCVILAGFLLIATESFHRINKAAVAMLVGVLCWMLYIGYGTDYVLQQYATQFADFLTETPDSKVHAAKLFIAENVFVNYIQQGAQIVFYLLSTMSIVEVLSNNGCFDFLKVWLRTRSTRRFFWILCAFTFVLSMNLDNLTTVVLMLGIVRVLIKEEKLRWIFGSAIVITANVAGGITVIGDSTTLMLWIKGMVTPTTLSMKLLLPVLVGLVVILFLIVKKLPRTIQFQDNTPRYRGDDSLLNKWQYLLMLVVGIGGLWFVPTFHRLTLMPPFVGSLCVLSVLWILNELFNRTLFSSGRMAQNTNKPLALQYDTIQNLLFFMGIFLALSAMQETGKLERFFIDIAKGMSNVYCLSGVIGVLTAFLGNVTTTLTSLSLFAHPEVIHNVEFAQSFATDGNFWILLSYTTAFGASMLTIGSVSGFSLMKMENVSFLWYVRHMTFKVVAGWLAGLIVYGIIDMGF